MRQSQVREFGKRHAPQRPAPAAALPAPAVFDIPGEQPPALTQIRREMGDALPAPPRQVPRSFRAAILAGLVTGCFLTGLDLGQPAAAGPALQPLLTSAGLGGLDAGLDGPAQPYLIALSLVAGGRAAASALLIAHRVLAAMKETSLIAYALSGTAINLVIAGVLQLAAGAPPSHGWPAEMAAGALAGFFYRVFAGAKFVTR